FFFTSRRRHTSWPRDWSSDVCSSDLAGTFPFGAHVAVARVDTETGEVELERIVAVDDAGRIISPVIAEGQRHGGIGSGIGQALRSEERRCGEELRCLVWLHRGRSTL